MAAAKSLALRACSEPHGHVPIEPWVLGQHLDTARVAPSGEPSGARPMAFGGLTLDGRLEAQVSTNRRHPICSEPPLRYQLRNSMSQALSRCCGDGYAICPID